LYYAILHWRWINEKTNKATAKKIVDAIKKCDGRFAITSASIMDDRND